MKTAKPIELSSEQRIELERMVRSKTLEVRAVRRAQIVLLAADGMGNREIAAALGIGRVQVGRWRNRFVEGGVERCGSMLCSFECARGPKTRCFPTVASSFI